MLGLLRSVERQLGTPIWALDASYSLLGVGRQEWGWWLALNANFGPLFPKQSIDYYIFLEIPGC